MVGLSLIIQQGKRRNIDNSLSLKIESEENENKNGWVVDEGERGWRRQNLSISICNNGKQTPLTFKGGEWFFYN